MRTKGGDSHLHAQERGLGRNQPAETLILDWETAGVSCWSHPVCHASLLRPSQFWGFPDGSVGEQSTSKAGDPGSIPGSGRSTGERIGYLLQYSWSFLVAQLVKNLPTMLETWVRSLHWEDPWRRERLPNPVFWPAEFHGLFHGVAEADTTERLLLHFTWPIPGGSVVKNLPAMQETRV